METSHIVVMELEKAQEGLSGSSNKLRFSFDFDGVLTEPVLIDMAKALLVQHEVVIVTSRDPDNKRISGQPVYDIAAELGIPADNIFFTKGDSKYKYLDDLSIDLHFDDDCLEVELINELCKARAKCIK